MWLPNPCGCQCAPVISITGDEIDAGSVSGFGTVTTWKFRENKGGPVSTPTQKRLRYDPVAGSANEAWKATWDNVVAWSTIFAVVAHALVFAFWPSWDASDQWLDPDEEALGTAWIALYALPSSGNDGGMAVPSLAIVADADSLPAETVDEPGIVGGSQLGLASLPERLRERLAGRNGPVPTIVQFSPATGPPGISDDATDSRAADEEDTPIFEDPTPEDVALLLETRPMDLSRLSAVRPQIVLPGTSAWILIRNPAEVDRFMNRTPTGSDSEAIALVDVTVWIDEYGSVEWAEISKSSGRQEMDEIALALFNEVASFRPARDQGVRVSMSAIFSVPFPW
jgi:TonB family protein